VSPVRPWVRSARARLTHSRTAVSVRSMSRATAPTVLPSSSTRRTTPALNSSVDWRRARRFGVLAIGLDIVSPSGKMSTDSDHAQEAYEAAKAKAKMPAHGHTATHLPFVRMCR
jgi:hypothetical protein